MTTIQALVTKLYAMGASSQDADDICDIAAILSKEHYDIGCSDGYNKCLADKNLIDDKAGVKNEPQIRSTFNHDIAIADNVNGYVNKDAA